MGKHKNKKHNGDFHKEWKEIKKFYKKIGKPDPDRDYMLFFFPEDIMNGIANIRKKFSGDLIEMRQHLKDFLAEYGFYHVGTGTNMIVFAHPQDESVVIKIATDAYGDLDNMNDAWIHRTFPESCEVYGSSEDGLVSVQERKWSFKTASPFQESFIPKMREFVRTVLDRGWLAVDVSPLCFKNYGIDRDGSLCLVDMSDCFPRTMLKDKKGKCPKHILKRDKDGVIRGHVCRGNLRYDDDLRWLICDKCGRDNINPLELIDRTDEIEGKIDMSQFICGTGFSNVDEYNKFIKQMDYVMLLRDNLTDEQLLEIKANHVRNSNIVDGKLVWNFDATHDKGILIAYMKEHGIPVPPVPEELYEEDEDDDIDDDDEEEEDDIDDDDEEEEDDDSVCDNAPIILRRKTPVSSLPAIDVEDDDIDDEDEGDDDIDDDEEEEDDDIDDEDEEEEKPLMFEGEDDEDEEEDDDIDDDDEEDEDDDIAEMRSRGRYLMGLSKQPDLVYNDDDGSVNGTCDPEETFDMLSTSGMIIKPDEELDEEYYLQLTKDVFDIDDTFYNYRIMRMDTNSNTINHMIENVAKRIAVIANLVDKVKNQNCEHSDFYEAYNEFLELDERERDYEEDDDDFDVEDDDFDDVEEFETPNDGTPRNNMGYKKSVENKGGDWLSKPVVKPIVDGCYDGRKTTEIVDIIGEKQLRLANNGYGNSSISYTVPVPAEIAEEIIEPMKPCKKADNLIATTKFEQISTLQGLCSMTHLGGDIFVYPNYDNNMELLKMILQKSLFNIRFIRDKSEESVMATINSEPIISADTLRDLILERLDKNIIEQEEVEHRTQTDDKGVVSEK